MAKRILLIEDDELLQDLYLRILQGAGYTTDGYVMGKDGLEASVKNSYDLILLDIMLPDINGLEILKSIKSNEKTKNIPILMISNLGQDTVIKQAFHLGAAGFLIKLSYTPDQVIAEVKKLLEGGTA